MGQTANYAIPYPGVSDAPDGPNGFQAGAEKTDVTLKGIDDRLKNVETGLPRYALGRVGHRDTPATSTGLGASATMLDYVSVSLKANRQYRFLYKTDIRTPDASAQYVCQILKSANGDTSPTGAVIETGNRNASPQVNSWSSLNWDGVYTPTADETVYVKAVIARLTGTSAYDVSARRLSVIDEGKP